MERLINEMDDNELQSEIHEHCTISQANKPSKSRQIREFLINSGRVFLAEFIGVAVICFAIMIYNPSTHGSVPIAAVVGVVFIWVVWVIGPISGAHVNPAVSFAMCLTRRIPIYLGIIYCLGQFSGAIVGTWVATLMTNGTGVIGMTMPAPHLTDFKATILEMIATAILVIAVLSVSDEFRASSWCQGHVTMFPFAFGATLAMLAAVFGPLTGGSMNPARSLGPAIVLNQFDRQWIYVVGPCLGSVVAVLLYELLLSQGATFPRIRAWFTDPNFDRKREYKTEECMIQQSKL